jgi:serine/threonine-protein kinase RsbW
MAGGNALTLTLPSRLALLPVVRSFVESVCQAGRLGRVATEEVILAANEAASNVIRHAHQGLPEATLQVRCTLLDNGIEVCLLDQGQPFNVSEVPHLDPSEMRTGGRGVFLMRALVDELSCCLGEHGGNILRMVKRCQPSLSSEKPT